VRPADVASWGYVPQSRVEPILEELPLRRFRDGEGNVLFDLPRAPLPPAAAPAPTRFLPTWDATLLVHARRAGMLAEEYRRIVFDPKNPRSVNTYLVDGRVAGAWRHEEGRIVLEPYEPLPRAARREVEEEAARLATLYAEGER
jgi:hypothetical protein